MWLQVQLGAQRLEPEPVAEPSQVGPPADSAGAAAVPAPVEDNQGHKVTSVAVMTDPVPTGWSRMLEDEAAGGAAWPRTPGGADLTTSQKAEGEASLPTDRGGLQR